MRRPSATEARHFGRPLPRDFYRRHVVCVARGLLGRVLVHEQASGVMAARIVEVEAYRGARDPASHAWRGETPRNRVMFGDAGYAYVYFTYGMHHCLNLVAEPAGQAAAVLVRAAEPLEGVARMTRRRTGAPMGLLLSGPGRLARAYGLTRRDDGLDLVHGPLWVSDCAPQRGKRRITAGPRIGITRGIEVPWRFFLEGHPGVSGARRSSRSVI